MRIVDVQMARGHLTERADAEDHAIVFPALLIDFQHRHTRSGARQSRLQATHRLFAAEAMRDRNNKRCRHRKTPALGPFECNSASPEKKGSVHYRSARSGTFTIPDCFLAGSHKRAVGLRRDFMSLGTIILIILIIALLGG